ncbi:MAG: DUF488 domain-containing protein [Candidatus Micrarchaeota archaeon]|nr:DUF488 domain-containing protein [Candidatus Micrarchaeota archaeon]MDE1847775.1 DUF488 domain-containing protein [Candidatus Micrarchaeota archaeon]MDE1864213.1 DUF488 domain-containing protein [Candidatus Micrarchaeota archaeon]
MAKNKQMVFTIGHSTRKLREFVWLLDTYKIKELVDIRTIPKSRANLQFNEKRLVAGLKRHHISYRHMEDLGGLRHPLKDSANTYWHNASFRGFADYMQTSEFGKSLIELMGLAKKRQTAIMCAEAVPWRCHRLLIADALLARGIDVIHIFSPTNSKPHKLTKSARVNRLNIVYK